MKTLNGRTSTRPDSFTGTEEARRANNATHDIDGNESRCVWCDCRPWGTWYDYQCNADPKTLPGCMVTEAFDDGSVEYWLNGKQLTAEEARAIDPFFA